MSVAVRSSLHRAPDFAVLDIGSHKCACYIAHERSFDGHQSQIEVSGVGHMLSKGIRASQITDSAEAETSIVTAVHAAEEMAEISLEKVLVSLNLSSLSSHHVTIDLALGNAPIHERDIQELLKEAASTLNEQEAALHILPFRFTLDEQTGIRDPLGMVGKKLTAEILVVTVPANQLRNLDHCLHRCQLEVEGYIAAPYASALACLEEDEKELGVTLIDMGAYTTSYAVFFGGRLVYVGCIGVGGQHITQDIAQGLNTSLQQAERLKTVHGGAIISPIDDTVMIEIQPIGAVEEDEMVTEKRSHLNHIIRPRVEEIFELTREAIRKGHLGNLTGNRLVLTGGASQLLGVNELASKIFDKQVRVARPGRIDGLADATSGSGFSTPIGMLNYLKMRKRRSSALHYDLHGKAGKRSFMQMLRWFKDNF